MLTNVAATQAKLLQRIADFMANKWYIKKIIQFDDFTLLMVCSILFRAKYLKTCSIIRSPNISKPKIAIAKGIKQIVNMSCIRQIKIK